MTSFVHTHWCHSILCLTHLQSQKKSPKPQVYRCSISKVQICLPQQKIGPDSLAHWSHRYCWSDLIVQAAISLGRAWIFRHLFSERFYLLPLRSVLSHSSHWTSQPCFTLAPPCWESYLVEHIWNPYAGVYLHSACSVRVRNLHSVLSPYWNILRFILNQYLAPVALESASLTSPCHGAHNAILSEFYFHLLLFLSSLFLSQINSSLTEVSEHGL